MVCFWLVFFRIVVFRLCFLEYVVIFWGFWWLICFGDWINVVCYEGFFFNRVIVILVW